MSYGAAARMPNAIWEKALEILDGDDRETQQLLARDLVSDDLKGLEIVLSMLSNENDDIEVWRPQTRDFMRTITHPALVDCLSVDPFVGTLFKFLAGTNGNRAIRYFTRLCGQLQNDHSGTIRSQKEGAERIEEIILLMLACLGQLFQRDRPIVLNDSLSGLLSLLKRIANTSSISQNAVSRIEALGQAIESQAIPLDGRKAQLNNVTQISAAVLTFPQKMDLPGDRHDNDHKDISRISILPTLGRSSARSRNTFLPPIFSSRTSSIAPDSGILTRHFVFRAMTYSGH